MTAWAALHVHARVRAGEWVAVHGCGGVGMAAIMIAVAAGAQVAAVDIDERKLERARELGAVPCRGGRRSPTSPAAARTCRSTRSGRAGHLRELDPLPAPPRPPRPGRAAARATSARSRIPMARVIAHELRVFGVHGMAVRHYDALLARGRRRHGRAGLVGREDDRARGGRATSSRRWAGSPRRA